jgi:hypothetical protein
MRTFIVRSRFLPTPAEQRPGAGRGGIPVIPLRDTVQQLVGSEESLISEAWMFVRLAFESLG